MTKHWRAVIGFEGWYEVNRHGQVRRIAKAQNGGSCSAVERVLKPFKMPDGYNKYILSKGTRATRTTVLGHWLVAAAFIGLRPKGTQIHHKDHNGANDDVSNLCYVTPSEHLTITNKALNVRFGQQHHLAKLDEDMVIQIRKLANSGISGVQLAANFNVAPCTVSRILLGKTWKHV